MLVQYISNEEGTKAKDGTLHLAKILLRCACPCLTSLMATHFTGWYNGETAHTQ